MKSVGTLLCLLWVACALSACNYTILKQPADASAQGGSDLLPEEKASMMNYAFMSARIFQPKCVACHRAGDKVNLQTYEAVLLQLAAINRAVFVDQIMPKRGELTAAERRLLANWLRLGGPLESPKAPPSVEPLIATYDSIRQHIFEPICMDCHNPKGTGKRIMLDRQSLIDSPLVLIDTTNVDESGLLIALERTDDKRMPLAKEGYSALAPEEINVIREWITNGAN